ncbi:MAG: McrC family protein [Nitrospirae bacterium]|nr:McrC family protein [Nitrospirota bacterium]
MNNGASVIELVEYESRFLPQSELTEEEAHSIYLQFDGKIAVEWPTPKTGNLWQLTSLGWVGFVPLGEGRGISLQPKVTLGNLFRMLEHAYDLPSFKLLEGLYDCESIRDFYERLATILARRLLDRAREGLYKTYRKEDAEISFIRGRIDIPALARKPVKATVPCSFEEHTMDVEDNQIVAWTLYAILRSGICTERANPILRKAERVLRNSVSLKPFCDFDCAGRNYNRLNADYEILHKLCRFFLENTGPTQNLGDRSMVPFLVDMARLFELFVARWLKLHLDVRYLLKSQETFVIGEKGALKMVMDLVLYDRETQRPLCVLDTKYKDGTVSNEDYNQVVAYADAVGCENAVLIYPKELEYPFDEKPGGIRVKTAVFDVGSELDQSGEKLLERLYAVIDYR